MKITLTYDAESPKFNSETDHDQRLQLGHGIAEGDLTPAQSPMQAVLSAVSACSSIDVVEILTKMRQPLEGLRVEVEGDRREEVPRIFTHIRLHFILTGALKEKKVEQALELSVNKYCSVAEMLKPRVDIQYSYKIISS